MIHRVRSKCAHSQSHMIYDVKLTQHIQEIAQLSPDPFPFGWGLGTRVREALLCNKQWGSQLTPNPFPFGWGLGTRLGLSTRGAIV